MTLSHIDITSYIWYIYTYIKIYVLYAVWGIYNMLYTCFVYVKLLILAATHAWFVDILASGHLSIQASRAPGQSVHNADFSVQPPLRSLSLSISLHLSLSLESMIDWQVVACRNLWPYKLRGLQRMHFLFLPSSKWDGAHHIDSGVITTADHEVPHQNDQLPSILHAIELPEEAHPAPIPGAQGSYNENIARHVWAWQGCSASLARNGLTYDVRQCTYTVGRFT